MFQFSRLALAFAAPLLLAGCLLTPGEFASTLHIGADRSFTFTYVGEVIVTDPGQSFQQGLEQGMQEGFEQGFEQGMGDADLDMGGDESGNVPPEGEDATGLDEAAPAPLTPTQPAEIGEAQRRQIIEALSREVGYRSVEYVGRNTFRVDYSISGRLDRGFVYPLNIDAAAILPWVAIELRNDGTARVTGMAFGDGGEAGRSGMGGGDEANRRRNGTFTLTTDAELVMHNNEQGTTPGQRTTVAWRITPTTRNAPTAVVRFAR